MKIGKKFSLRKTIARICWILSILAGVPLFVFWIIIAQPVFFPSKRKPATPVDPERLKAHVRTLSENFVPRDWTNTENLDKTASYISDHFKRAKGDVSEQLFEASGITYKNVVAGFGPETEEIVIVGAHYDAVSITPGADDNASAVAGLIELGYLIGETDLQTRVVLVSYPLEEPPNFGTESMGSAVHAASMKAEGKKIRIMICLEMIGYFVDSKGSQDYPVPALRLYYPSKGNFITVVGKIDQRPLVRRVKKAMISASRLPVCSINAPTAIPGIDFSDHRNYWKEGYQAVMITDTAFYRNPHYHTELDTWDTLDYERMAMTVRGVHAAVLEFAGDG